MEPSRNEEARKRNRSTKISLMLSGVTPQYLIVLMFEKPTLTIISKNSYIYISKQLKKVIGYTVKINSPATSALVFQFIFSKINCYVFYDKINILLIYDKHIVLIRVPSSETFLVLYWAGVKYQKASPQQFQKLLGDSRNSKEARSNT